MEISKTSRIRSLYMSPTTMRSCPAQYKLIFLTIYSSEKDFGRSQGTSFLVFFNHGASVPRSPL